MKNKLAVRFGDAWRVGSRIVSEWCFFVAGLLGHVGCSPRAGGRSGIPGVPLACAGRPSAAHAGATLRTIPGALSRTTLARKSSIKPPRRLTDERATRSLVVRHRMAWVNHSGKADQSYPRLPPEDQVDKSIFLCCVLSPYARVLRGARPLVLLRRWRSLRGNGYGTRSRISLCRTPASGGARPTENQGDCCRFVFARIRESTSWTWPRATSSPAVLLMT